MFPNRGQAARGERERKAPQRRELVPLFGRVSENPFYRACFIIDADDKIFPAGNDQRVIRAIIITALLWNQSVGAGKNELAGIISPGPHGCADNIGKVPFL